MAIACESPIYRSSHLGLRPGHQQTSHQESMFFGAALLLRTNLNEFPYGSSKSNSLLTSNNKYFNFLCSRCQSLSHQTATTVTTSCHEGPHGLLKYRFGTSIILAKYGVFNVLISGTIFAIQPTASQEFRINNLRAVHEWQVKQKGTATRIFKPWF